MRLSDWGRELAENLLCKEYPHHWDWTRLVAQRAEVLGRVVLPNDEREVLSAAAWLHRTGVAVEARETRFVPLDSARYIASMTTFPERVVALIAHQSSAATTATTRGLTAELAVYPDEESLTRDVLWYCATPDVPDFLELAHRSRQDAFEQFLGRSHPVTLAHAAGQVRTRAAASRVLRALEASDLL